MAENSGIAWTHHTLNPWIGCTKVSPACDHCYAEVWDARFAGDQPHWGAKAPRRRTKTAQLSKVRKWAVEAASAGERHRVFCASLADVFDNHASIKPEWRNDLWALIRATPELDWLLLTKRPQNIAGFLPPDWGPGYPNVWLGTSVENQTEAARRIPVLDRIPAVVRFLSMEPLLEAVDLTAFPRMDWIIVGGESGPDFRAMDADWARQVRDYCADQAIPFFFKQWHGRSQQEIKKQGALLDGAAHAAYPVAGDCPAQITPARCASN